MNDTKMTGQSDLLAPRDHDDVRGRGRFLSLLGTLLGTILLLGACKAAPAWRWTRVEAGLPHQGLTLAVAVDPADPARLWAGFYDLGGLASSVDGGQTWQNSPQGRADNPVFDLLVQPAGQLWAATRDGLLYSEDRGASWQPVEASLPGQAAFALAGGGQGRLYAGLDNAGLYQGSDPDMTWLSLNRDPRLGTAAILAVAASPDERYLYAGTAAQGLFASQDAGQTWSAAFKGAYVPNLAVDPERPEVAIASLRDRLVLTGDGGRSWRELPLAWAAEDIFALLWASDGHLWAGSRQGRLYQSTDRGDVWTIAGEIPGGSGILDLALAGERLLAATWTGLYATDNGGRDWINLSPTLGLPNAHTLLAIEHGLLLGTRAGLFRWQSEQDRWQTVADLAAAGQVTALTATADDQILYAGTGAGLYRSDNGGQNWALVPSDSHIGSQYLAPDPSHEERIYKLAVWERVYKSEDSGQTWQAQWRGLGVTVEGTSLAIDPLNPHFLYLGSEMGLYRSIQGGDQWHPVAPTLADQTILTIVARPPARAEQSLSTLYLGTTRGLYRSLDGGSTVEPWGQGLADLSVTALLFDPATPQRLYAGTAFAGIYESTNGGQQWQPIGLNDLNTEIIQALAWGPSGRLFAISLGGVWVGERGW